MKRINHYVLNGAIALLSTAGLVACSSDDVTDAPVNPTYDGKSVKTQFAINIATPSNSQTRMSAENTQNGGNFLGMENIYLIPFVNVPEASLNGTTERTNYTFPSSVIELTKLLGSDIDNITDKKNYHIYYDVNVPIGTKNFLFYGTSPISESTYKTKGALKVTNLTTLTQNSTSAISYSLVDIAATSGTNNAITSTQTGFANYLSAIAKADGWSTIAENENATLFNAYKNFTVAPTNGGLRAGSAAAIKEMIQSLTTIVNPLKTKDGETATNVSGVADKIIEKIKADYFDIDANGIVSWLTSLGEETTKFPTNLGLPEGCMILNCTDGNFSYVSQPTMPSSGSSTINLYDITYPAAIAYRANTELAAKSEEVSSWPTQYGNWENSNWEGWGNEVSVTTRSIALKKNIQYGVAQMVTKIQTASSILNDNSTDNRVSVNAESFPVTGILVGGQRQSIDWEFLPDGSTQRVIYDADIPSDTYAASTDWSNPIYTLVFDNYVDGDKEAQETVRIAVELQNNSTADFTGVDGIVAAGQKFYLIAELNPKASGLTPISWPNSNTNRFPQFGIDRTFVQDYKTCVNLTINTLKNAYVTIPDLRSVKLQLGLSVDLQWQSGLTFNVPLGGTD